jgi:iron complex outermembrane recepter protein
MRILILSFFVLFLGNVLQAQMQLTVTVVGVKKYLPIAGASVSNGSQTKITSPTGKATVSKFKVDKIKITAPEFETVIIGSESFADSTEITIYLKPAKDLNEAIEVKAIIANNKAPFAITNLNKEFIAKHNTGADLPFMLTQIPNVIAHSDAGNGIGYTGLRIRGTDATRTNITLNGMPFNDSESQGSFFVNLPDFLSSAESIQVQRGVGSSTNGPGSFGASVHINTFKPVDIAGVNFNNTIGSFGTIKNTLKINSGKIKDHFYFDARLSHVKSNGFIDRAKANLKGYFLSGSFVKSKTSITVNSFSGTEKTYQAWYGIPEALLNTNPTYNEAGNEKTGSPYENEVDNYTQTNHQIILRHKINNQTNLHVTAYYVKGGGYYEQYKSEVKYSALNLTAPIGISRTDIVRQLWLKNDLFGGNYSFQYTSFPFNIVYGGSVSNYIGDHFGKVIWAAKGGVPNNHSFYNAHANKLDVNQFLKTTYSFSNVLSAYADAQFRHVQYNIYGFRNNPNLNALNKFNFFNPKLGLQYQKLNTKIFTSIAIANKEPNRDDFEASIAQQPKAEKLTDLEIGYETMYKNKLRIAAAFYLMQYKNQLVLTGAINDVGAQTRTNVAKSFRNGIEFEADYMLSSSFNIKANATFSSNKINNFNEYIADYDNGTVVINNYKNTTIALSPSSIFNITPTLRVSNKVFLEWQNQFVGMQYLDNTTNKNRALKKYYNSNVLGSYTKVIQKISANFFIQVNNIFNKKYTPNGYTYNFISGGVFIVNNYYYPMAGRNVLAGINLSF